MEKLADRKKSEVWALQLSYRWMLKTKLMLEEKYGKESEEYKFFEKFYKKRNLPVYIMNTGMVIGFIFLLYIHIQKSNGTLDSKVLFAFLIYIGIGFIFLIIDGFKYGGSYIIPNYRALKNKRKYSQEIALLKKDFKIMISFYSNHGKTISEEIKPYKHIKDENLIKELKKIERAV